MGWWRHPGPRATRRTVVAMLAAVLACGPGVITAPASASVSAPISYVALGDSRAAGPTRTSQLADAGCGRTTNGYPNLIAAALSPASFTDVTCGGATTADVVDREQITNPPSRRRVPVQVSALRTDTTLVTLSIGGNDVRWRSLLTPCFSRSLSVDRDCRADPALRATIDARLATLATSIDHVLLAIRARSPMARIVVLGHGGYFGARGCAPDAQLSGPDVAFVDAFFDRLDNVMAGSALRNNAIYVDIASVAVGHDACAPGGTRWFTGSVPRGDTPANHPTPAGSAAMARQALAAIRG